MSGVPVRSSRRARPPVIPVELRSALTGSGKLVMASYGAVVEKEINQPFTVDTGHLVAWEPSLEYRIQGAGGIKQTLLSGEGLTMQFTGTGRIWLQSRNLAGLASWLTKYC